MASLDVVSPRDIQLFPAGNLDNRMMRMPVVCRRRPDSKRQWHSVGRKESSAFFIWLFFLARGANHVLARAQAGMWWGGEWKEGMERPLRTSDQRRQLRVGSDVVFHQCGAPLARCCSCFLHQILPNCRWLGGCRRRRRLVKTRPPPRLFHLVTPVTTLSHFSF